MKDFGVRGIVDQEGDVYFYVGYDFEINGKTEAIFFSHLKELVEELNLKSNVEIFGGLIKQDFGKWPPRKGYGKIEDNL